MLNLKRIKYVESHLQMGYNPITAIGIGQHLELEFKPFNYYGTPKYGSKFFCLGHFL